MLTNTPPNTIHEAEGVTIGLRFAHNCFYRLHVERNAWLRCCDNDAIAAVQTIIATLTSVPFKEAENAVH